MRALNISLIAGLSVLLAGCTSLLWKDSFESDIKRVNKARMQDHLKGFGVITDKTKAEQMVLVGESSWYVMDSKSSQQLLSVLRLPLSEPLKLVSHITYNDTLDDSGVIEGSLNAEYHTFDSRFCLSHAAKSTKDKLTLSNADFNLRKQEQVYLKCFDVAGKAYSQPENIKLKHIFKKPIGLEFSVYEYKTSWKFDEQLPMKVMLTPFTLAFDAVFYSLYGIEEITTK